MRQKDKKLNNQQKYFFFKRGNKLPRKVAHFSGIKGKSFMRYWGEQSHTKCGDGLEGIVLQVETRPQIKTQRWERPSKAGVKHIRGAIM